MLELLSQSDRYKHARLGIGEESRQSLLADELNDPVATPLQSS